MKKCIFTLLFSFSLAIAAYSQVGVRLHAAIILPTFASSTPIFKSQETSVIPENNLNLISNTCTTPPPLSGLWQYEDLAFFCKIEIQLEKSVQLPVKFRLGSVQYVDYLEQK